MMHPPFIDTTDNALKFKTAIYVEEFIYIINVRLLE